MTKHIVFDCDGTLIDTHKMNYPLFPGIKELLLGLPRDCLLYVWTARDRRSLERILTDHGVRHLFEGLYTSDDFYPKPHFRGLIELLGEVDKSQVWIIGDTTIDILGAKHFGVKSIGAVWGLAGSSESLIDAGADLIAQEPNQCIVWVTQNNI
jgi:phosphoglycolate phosphatase